MQLLLVFFLRAELSERHQGVGSRRCKIRVIIHQILSVTWWVDQSGFCVLLPELTNVTVSPRAVCSDSISKDATPAISEFKDVVVSMLEKTCASAPPRHIRINLADHVTRDSRIVRVAQHAAAKE